MAGGDSAAAAAAAVVDAWVKQKQTGPTETDWRVCLSQIRVALEKLCASKIVRSDDRAQRIIERMVSAPDMETFAADVDLLGDRVAELTGAGLGQQRWRTPVLNLAGFEQQRTRRDADEAMPRMVIRL